MKTPREILIEISERARTKRLGLNLTRAGLSLRSGVSVSVIRQFETTGKISLESLVKIAVALGDDAGFGSLFAHRVDETISIDELLKHAQTRKRGRLT